MKVAAFDSPKTADLKRRLGVRLSTAIGLLELMWKFTAQHAPTGAIGKWTDDAIAAACDWERAGEELIHALLHSGWLEKHPEHRLIVHDWQEHAPNYVRSMLNRKGWQFVKSLNPGDSEPDLSGDSLSLVKSSLVKPSEKTAAPTAPRERERDLVWEATLLACGISLDDPLSESQRKAINHAVSKIKRVLREGRDDVSEIFRRADKHRELWPRIRCTPTSLERHWNEVQASAAGKRPVSERKPPDPAVERAIVDQHKFNAPPRAPGEPMLVWLKRVSDLATASIDARQMSEVPLAA